MKLRSIHIEGFRGINRPLDLEFNNKLTVLAGENGSGKTSIFQAIEWCLFGRLDFSGVEFQKEDAIVNDYHPGEEAKVVVIMDDGTQITRTRTKKGSTRFGARDSKLEVVREDENLQGEDAQNHINEILNISVDELGAAVHLRQETIRDFIQGQPAKRSETVDKMIGLINLRELISGIDPKLVEKEITSLEKQVSQIDRNMIQATLIAREMLANREKQLIQEGATRDELNLEGAIKIFGDIDGAITNLGEMTGKTYPLTTPNTLRACKEEADKVKEISAELQEARVHRNKEILEAISRLKTTHDKFKDAKEDLKEYAGVDPDELTNRNQEAVKERDQAKESLKQKNSRLSELSKVHRQCEELLELERLITEDTGVLDELGSIEEIEADIDYIKLQEKDIEAKIKKATRQSQLIIDAAKYLDDARPDECPVCQRPLQKSELEEVIKYLEDLIDDDPFALELNKLRQDEERLGGEKAELAQRMREIESTKSGRDRRKKEMASMRIKIDKSLGNPPEGSLVDFVDSQITSIEAEINSLQTQISEKSSLAASLEGKMRSLRNKEKEIEGLRKELRKEFGDSANDHELLDLVKNRVGELQQEASKLQELGSNFAELAKLTQRYLDILNLETDRENLVRLEKDYPTAVSQKQALEEAIGELREMGLALQDIFLASTEHQRGLVEGLLKQLIPEINKRFTKILGHPVYSELQIIPEEEKKGVYRYWIGARDPKGMRSTYVSTRFSTAQRNAAALAIFMAMSDLLAHNMNVLMIDEPTQSMDPRRQEAIAEYLIAESEENQIIIGTEIPDFAKILEKGAENISVYNFEPWETAGSQLQEA